MGSTFGATLSGTSSAPLVMDVSADDTGSGATQSSTTPPAARRPQRRTDRPAQSIINNVLVRRAAKDGAYVSATEDIGAVANNTFITAIEFSVINCGRSKPRSTILRNTVPISRLSLPPARRRAGRASRRSTARTRGSGRPQLVGEQLPPAWWPRRPEPVLVVGLSPDDVAVLGWRMTGPRASPEGWLPDWVSVGALTRAFRARAGGSGGGRDRYPRGAAPIVAGAVDSCTSCRGPEQLFDRR